MLIYSIKGGCYVLLPFYWVHGDKMGKSYKHTPVSKESTGCRANKWWKRYSNKKSESTINIFQMDVIIKRFYVLGFYVTTDFIPLGI